MSTLTVGLQCPTIRPTFCFTEEPRSFVDPREGKNGTSRVAYFQQGPIHVSQLSRHTEFFFLSKLKEKMQMLSSSTVAALAVTQVQKRWGGDHWPAFKSQQVARKPTWSSYCPLRCPLGCFPVCHGTPTAPPASGWTFGRVKVSWTSKHMRCGNGISAAH